MQMLTDEDKVTLSYAKESSVALMKDMVALVERLAKLADDNQKEIDAIYKGDI